MTRRPSAALQPLTADAYHTTADAIRPGDGAENQMVYAVDARGFVCAVRLVAKGDSDFMAGMRRQRDQFPLDPSTIADDGWPRDAEGRPLSLLEVEQQAYAEDAERRASARQERAA